MKNKIKIIILFGDPGAGKGTQAEILAKKTHFNRISTGDLVRNEMRNKSALAKDLIPFYNAGKPAPNKIINNLVENKIKELKQNSGIKGIIFDTFPFDNEQADFLASISEKYGLNKPIIIWIDVPDKEILKRLGSRLICTKCNKIFRASEVSLDKCPNCQGSLEKRADDEEKLIKNRIKVYKKVESEHRKYYKDYNYWFDVNGDQKIEKVSQDIWSVIKSNFYGE